MAVFTEKVVGEKTVSTKVYCCLRYSDDGDFVNFEDSFHSSGSDVEICDVDVITFLELVPDI